MRPRSIVSFEWVMIAWCLITLAQIVMSFDAVSMGVISPLVFAGAAAGMFIMGILTYFISRRASSVAMWILVILLTLSLLGFMMTSLRQDLPTRSFFILATKAILHVIAIVLLFVPDSRSWLRHRGKPPSGLEQTFS